MAFFKDKFFAQSFVLLLALNSIYIVLAQFYNLPKLFDFKWWYSFFYREIMLFVTYFMAFCLIYALPFRRVKRGFIAIICAISLFLLLVNIFIALNFYSTLNEYFFGIILQTDPNEVGEFFGTYFTAKFALCAALALGLCFAAFRFGANAFEMAQKRRGGGAFISFLRCFLSWLSQSTSPACAPRMSAVAMCFTASPYLTETP